MADFELNGALVKAAWRAFAKFIWQDFVKAHTLSTAGVVGWGLLISNSSVVNAGIEVSRVVQGICASGRH